MADLEPTTNPKLHLAAANHPTNLSGLKRLNSLLFPIAYGEKFYKDILTSPSSGSLTRVAFWDGGIGVVGGVRARLEEDDATQTKRIYIMTLCTLSPFRRLGVASALLDHIVRVAREWQVEEVYAHVWEENHEALEWYARRGFEVEKEVIQGYYRKLRPGGAIIVKLRIGHSPNRGVLEAIKDN